MPIARIWKAGRTYQGAGVITFPNSQPTSRTISAAAAASAMARHRGSALRGTGNGLEWVSNDGEKETILTQEPDSTPWLRIKSWLLTPFVPVEQL